MVLRVLTIGGYVLAAATLMVLAYGLLIWSLVALYDWALKVWRG